jgi:hypothetical protein
MNFLAHYVFIQSAQPPPAVVLGNALPDLLPLADPHSRFRLSHLDQYPVHLLREGVRSHLSADAAFHKAPSFLLAQTEIKALFQSQSFPSMRLRLFFLAHITAELALDAALLRADPAPAAAFYADLAAADFAEASAWCESALRRPLPRLPAVLEHFARSRYLFSYAQEEGVAKGISRLCGRAHQDIFTGSNFARLCAVAAQAVPLVTPYAPALFAETQAGDVPTTWK